MNTLDLDQAETVRQLINAVREIQDSCRMGDIPNDPKNAKLHCQVLRSDCERADRLLVELGMLPQHEVTIRNANRLIEASSK